MSCITKLQPSGPGQLVCTFPQNAAGIEGIEVYFNPSGGEERLVLDCARFVEMECDSKEGFVHELSDSSHFEITLPDTFSRQTGTFRCQAPRLSSSLVKPCLWPPVVLKPPEGNEGYSSSSMKTTSLENSSHLEMGSDNSGGERAVVIGLWVAFAAIIIVILVVIAVMLYKRREGNHKTRVIRKNSPNKSTQLREIYLLEALVPTSEPNNKVKLQDICDV